MPMAITPLSVVYYRKMGFRVVLQQSDGESDAVYLKVGELLEKIEREFLDLR